MSGFIVVRIGAVIADFRIGEDYNLATIGRIGEYFLIAGDGSIKNYFPVTFAFCSVAFASEDPTVFQRKDRLHSLSGGVDFTDSNRRADFGQGVPQWKPKFSSPVILLSPSRRSAPLN